MKLAGKWDLIIKNKSYELELDVPSGLKKDKNRNQMALANNQLEGKVTSGDESLNLIELIIDGSRIEYKLEGALIDIDGTICDEYSKMKNLKEWQPQRCTQMH